MSVGDLQESERLGLTAHIRAEDEGFEVYNLAHGHLFRTEERFRCVLFADGWNDAIDRMVDAPSPAEDWETVTAEQVKVGDEVEVTQEGRGWRAVTSGKVTYASKSAVTFGDTYTVAAVPSRTLATATIRRRIRTPMAEPVGPAVVRHAGRVLARPDRNMTYPWAVMQGLPFTQDLMYGSWPEVLALGPGDPVVVDLGAPTGYVLTGDGRIEDAT